MISTYSLEVSAGNRVVAPFKVLLTPQEKAWIAKNPKLIVRTSSNWPPFEYKGINGSPAGSTIDMLSVIAERTGLNIVPQMGHWPDSLRAFKDGKVDLLVGVKYLNTREKFGLYSDSYTEVLDYFFAHESLRDVPFEQLTHKRIAIPKAYATQQFIRHNFPTLEMVEVDSLYDAIDKVIEGKAELIFNNYQTVSYILHQESITEIVPIKSMRHTGKSPIHLLIRKDAPILKSIINKGLTSITLAEKERFTQAHMGLATSLSTDRVSDNKLVLSAQEKEYLIANPTITLTGDPHWLPYEGIDSHGNYIGIVADILDIFEKRLGISIERNIGATWQDSVSLFQRKEVDLISETFDSNITDKSLYSNVYLSSPIVVVMRDDQRYVSDLQSISHLKMALIRDYGYTKQISNTFPEHQFTKMNSIEDGLTAVATGRVDVLFATLAQASYHIANMGINNVRIVGDTPFKTELAFGAHEDNKILISIFNKTLNSISSVEKQAIINRWSKDKFVSHVDYVSIVVIILGALLLITIIVWWYQRLISEIRARQEAQSHYKALLNLLPTQVMIIDQNGLIKSVNAQVLRDYDVKDAVFYDAPFTDLLHTSRSFDYFTKQIKSSGFEQVITEFCWQNKISSMMLSMLEISYDNKPAYLALAVDITERITMEKMIIEAKNTAIEANNAKTSFLANMSHEIRTPMNAIIGFTELLFNEVRDPKMVSYIKTIRSAGNSLLLLINDILDLSKIESGKLHIQHSAVDIYHMIEDIEQVFDVEVQKKLLSFEVKIADNVPAIVMLDEARLRQVLFNLIGNAVKFTHQGGISLTINAVTDGIDCVALTFSIKDTGIGISEAYQESIFNSFVQPKHQDVAQYGGSGLGLAISKRLINLMHGELTLDSTEGCGSVFSFSLPKIDVVGLSASNHLTLNRNNDVVNFNGLTVLIADDVEDNRHLLEQLLPNWGLNVFAVSNGLEAVESVKERRFDLALLDIRMPKMNGYDAAKKIREINPSLPIIAITASVMSDEEEINRRHHFDGYLRKPVLQKHVINELKRHLPFVNHKEKNVPSLNEELLLTTELMSYLQTNYLASCENLLTNNNIDEFSTFIAKVRQVSIEHESASLKNFTAQWQMAVDCLDVLEIQQFTQRLIMSLK